jgi:hypothetical protein
MTCGSHPTRWRAGNRANRDRPLNRADTTSGGEAWSERPFGVLVFVMLLPAANLPSTLILFVPKERQLIIFVFDQPFSK